MNYGTLQALKSSSRVSNPVISNGLRFLFQESSLYVMNGFYFFNPLSHLAIFLTDVLSLSRVGEYRS